MTVSVSLSVCLSTSISPKLHVRSSPHFSACYLCPCMARASSGGVAIRYVRTSGFNGGDVMLNMRREKGVCSK